MAGREEHRTTKRLSPGSIVPLGATLTPGGVNFALFSRNANEVRLELFDDPTASHRRHPRRGRRAGSSGTSSSTD